MAFDPFQDYKTAGYLQNRFKMPLGSDLKRLEHTSYMVALPQALAYLKKQSTPHYDDLLCVHRILFQSIYPTWAGKDRMELTPHQTVCKGNTVFAQPHTLRQGFDFALRGASVGTQLGNLAYTHPFLDGNGRALFTFFEDHLRRNGMGLRWEQLNRNTFLTALDTQIAQPDGSHLDNVLQPHLYTL